MSKATAILGTMMNVKPVLHVDDEGHLIAVGKVRGRKKSISALVDRMAEQMNGFAAENDVVFISHGDCMEDVEYLERLIREKFGITEFLVNEVGPTIGAHSGPGTLAVFFVGEPREQYNGRKSGRSPGEFFLRGVRMFHGHRGAREICRGFSRISYVCACFQRI